MRIFLIGFMGSGKSRTGQSLAALIGVPFVDLDEYIEERSGMSVSDIFSHHGEGYFRELERDLLTQLIRLPAFVLATGGGTACYHDAVSLMCDHGTTVFLDPPVATLYQRLADERDHRPLLRECADLKSFIASTLDARRPFYEQADITYRGTETADVVARKIVQRLPSPTPP
jgi:shikimate kinase